MILFVELLFILLLAVPNSLRKKYSKQTNKSSENAIWKS